MFDKHKDVITTPDFSATAEEIYLFFLLSAMQAQMRNTYDTLWTSPSSCLLIQQNMTLLIWINILEIKKSFLIYFTAKNTKVNLILRSQAVV